MNIGYIIDIGCCMSSFDGIRIQAQTWAAELERKGHVVTLINPWSIIRWKAFDVVHIFGQNENVLGWSRTISQFGIPVMISPIIDTIQTVQKYKMVSLLNIPFLRMSSVNNKMRRSDQYITGWLARSEYESLYIHEAYGVPKEKIAKVPLSFRIESPRSMPQKKNYCLHVSNITDGRKNVLRLMQAAVKYQFELVLAGSVNEADFEPIKTMIESHSNISYLGRVSDEKLKDLYREAKVFALPSICEGVGMVAVEAAAYGCNIVVTQLGGPKEYYDDMAFVVDPYNVDDIGEKVVAAMNDFTNQPQLMNHIVSKYNLSECVDSLLKKYQKFGGKNE